MKFAIGVLVGGAIVLAVEIGLAVLFRPTERDHYVRRIPRDLDGRPTRGRR